MFKRIRDWVEWNICPVPLLVTLFAVVLFSAALFLAGCGGKNDITGINTGIVPTPTAIAATPTPTPSVNSLTFISANPPPGSILPLGTQVNVTVGYHALQAGGIFALPTGGSVLSSDGFRQSIAAGTGTAKPYFTANGLGTSTGLLITMQSATNATVLEITVPVTYTWVGTYNYSLAFVSANPPSGSTLKVGDLVTLNVTYGAYQIVTFQASFNSLATSCQKSNDTWITTGISPANFQCTSTQSGTSTGVTITMANGTSVLDSVNVPLTYTWQ